MRAAPGIAGVRRVLHVGALGIVAMASISVFPGCFATSKHVRVLEENITRQNAWDDERFEQMAADLESVQAQNQALRLRMDDLSSQIAQLGGEVSSRITELTAADERAVDAAQRASQSTETLAEERERDREELLDRMNVILDEVLKENADLTKRLESLEKSAYVFGQTHKVVSGETVASIAAKYGTTAQAIIDANGLGESALIRVGQELMIPGMGR